MIRINSKGGNHTLIHNCVDDIWKLHTFKTFIVYDSFFSSFWAIHDCCKFSRSLDTTFDAQFNKNLNQARLFWFSNRLTARCSAKMFRWENNNNKRRHLLKQELPRSVCDFPFRQPVIIVQDYKRQRTECQCSCEERRLLTIKGLSAEVVANWRSKPSGLLEPSLLKLLAIRQWRKTSKQNKSNKQKVSRAKKLLTIKQSNRIKFHGTNKGTIRSLLPQAT